MDIRQMIDHIPMSRWVQGTFKRQKAQGNASSDTIETCRESESLNERGMMTGSEYGLSNPAEKFEHALQSALRARIETGI
jgi:hypothetical protein